MIIFDYSGTLSRNATRFARPDNLVEVLKISGLAAYGIATPRAFWERIVNPTWKEGSKTRIGYVGTIIRAVGDENDRALHQAAERFVSAYLNASMLERDWVPTLTWLQERPDLYVLIATDHYAEATEMIARELAREGIWAVSVMHGDNTGGGKPILIANSADIGHHKDETAFWNTVYGRLAHPKLTRMLLIDDFGCAEEAGDAYRELWMTRRERTVMAIEEGLGGKVEAWDFLPTTSPIEMGERIIHWVEEK